MANIYVVLVASVGCLSAAQLFGSCQFNENFFLYTQINVYSSRYCIFVWTRFGLVGVLCVSVGTHKYLFLLPFYYYCYSSSCPSFQANLWFPLFFVVGSFLSLSLSVIFFIWLFVILQAPVRLYAPLCIYYFPSKQMIVNCCVAFFSCCCCCLENVNGIYMNCIRLILNLHKPRFVYQRALCVYLFISFDLFEFISTQKRISFFWGYFDVCAVCVFAVSFVKYCYFLGIVCSIRCRIMMCISQKCYNYC